MTTRIIAGVQYPQDEKSKLEVFERPATPPSKKEKENGIRDKKYLNVVVNGDPHLAKTVHGINPQEVYAVTWTGVCRLNLEECLTNPDDDTLGRAEFHTTEPANEKRTGTVVSLDSQVFWGSYVTAKLGDVHLGGRVYCCDAVSPTTHEVFGYSPNGPLGVMQDRLVIPSGNRLFFVHPKTGASHKLYLPTAEGYEGEEVRRVNVTALATSGKFGVAATSDGHYHIFDQHRVHYTSPNRADISLPPEELKLSLPSVITSAAIEGDYFFLGTYLGKVLSFRVEWKDPLVIKREAVTDFSHEVHLKEDEELKRTNQNYEADYYVRGLKIVRSSGNPHLFVAYRDRVYECTTQDAIKYEHPRESSSFRKYVTTHRIKSLEVITDGA